MLARDMMRPADADIHVDHNLHEAGVRFDRSGRERLLVIDADEVVGVLHRADLSGDKVPSEAEGRRHLTVQEVMPAKEMPGCAAEAPEEEVRRLLQDHPFALVLDRERHVLGIIERDDLTPAGPDTAPEGDSPTGGRAAGHDEGNLQVYADRPRLRRLRDSEGTARG